VRYNIPKGRPKKLVRFLFFKKQALSLTERKKKLYTVASESTA
jgi:hypothetical protein